MKNVSNKYLSKMQDGIRTYIPRMSIDGVELDGEIQSGLTINMGSCGPSQFTIGNAYIPYITASLTGCNRLLQDREILLEMGLVLADGTTEYHKMGYFTVEKPLADKDQKSFTAYGRLMSKAGGLYTSNLSYPAAITSVLNEIKSQTGLNIVLNGLTASGTIETPIVGALHREALMLIAGLLGGFVTENGNGEIVLSKYSLNKAVTVDTDFCYTYPETSDEKYTVTGVSVMVRENGTDEDGNTVEGEKYASDGDINVSIHNPYMTASLFGTCESNIVGFSYMPAKVEFLGDISLEPWDSIVLTDEDPNNGIDIPCMNIVHTWDGGLVTTVTAPGQTATETGSSFGGPLSALAEKTYQKLLTAEKIIATKITADQILTDDITAATGHFTKYLTGVNIVGDLITAGTISTERLVIRDKNSNSGILYEINNGIVSQAGLNAEQLKRLTLNGQVITAESITADKINVTDLFAQNITATGSITGLEFISSGKDFYGHPSGLNLNAGRLRFESAESAYSPLFTTDVSGHQILLSYDSRDGYKSQLWMNGNLLEMAYTPVGGVKTNVLTASGSGVSLGATGLTVDLKGTVKENGTELSDKYAAAAHVSDTSCHVTSAEKQAWNGKSNFSGSYNDLSNKPTIPTVPTNVSAFNNDAGYLKGIGSVDISCSNGAGTVLVNKSKYFPILGLVVIDFQIKLSSYPYEANTHYSLLTINSAYKPSALKALSAMHIVSASGTSTTVYQAAMQTTGEVIMRLNNKISANSYINVQGCYFL